MFKVFIVCFLFVFGMNFSSSNYNVNNIVADCDDNL